MCGIIGYIGEENAVGIVLQGLKNLEYRGYDSYGIAWQEKGIRLFKKTGTIKEDVNANSSMAIGHTRWATHGKVSRENAHPHTDCSGEIVIVHNGIIENYNELKKELMRKGHVFKSDTDSEVIAHLIEEGMKEVRDLEKAVRNTFRKLEGSYAVLVIREGEEKIIGVRKDSPLVMGISDSGLFAASDAPAFLQHTKRVAWLYNNDMIILSRNGFRVLDLNTGKQVNREVETIDWNAEQASKGEFKHFMLKEILEQISVLKKTASRKDVGKAAEMIKKAGNVVLTGCGTSYHACLSAEYSLAREGVNARAVLSSEMINYSNLINEKTLVIAVSQSGETADVLEAVKIAKKKKARILSLVNVKGSSLERESQETLLLNAGPEICVLSTKSYTSQVALLTMISERIAGKESFLEKAWKELYNLTSLSSRKRIKKIAEKMKDAKSIIIIGRNHHYATALEAGLKIREVSYIPAFAFAGGELKHGNIALVEKGTPCIVFGCDKDTISNAVEMKTRGGWIIGISPQYNEAFDDWIRVPEAGEYNTITHIIPAQILAYYLATLKGLDPDKPRNLAKSVTVK